MPSAIYQKYRPKVWTDLADQNHVRTTLEHEIERGELAHAYLFVGPRGVGKTTVARIFAKAVNCQNRPLNSAEPCNNCEACVRIQSGRSFDIIEIDAASHTGVDHVREHILAGAEVHAGHGRYRVFIIDEVHMLSTAAFNAMLKSLEEPPPHVIFILATTEVHKVPATIISRCQRFDFKKIPADTIRKRLRFIVQAEKVVVDEAVLGAIAEHADGSLRDAESALGQVLALGDKNISVDEASLVIPRSNLKEAASLVDFILQYNAPQALSLVNNLVEQGISVSVFMQDVIIWLRNMLLAKVGERLDLFSTTTLGELQGQLMKNLGDVSIERLREIIDIFLKRRQRLGDSPIPQLPLELAIIESCANSADEPLSLDTHESVD